MNGVRVVRADGSEAILPLHRGKEISGLPPAKAVRSPRATGCASPRTDYVPETRRELRAEAKTASITAPIYEVDGFTPTGDIKLTNGFVVPKDYGGLTHGYVVTSHASQGKTVDKVLIALGSESLAAANREQFYVSVSRGREAVRLYTDDKAAMVEAVEGSSARLSATELMHGVDVTPPDRQASRRRLTELHDIKQAQYRRRERLAAYDLLYAMRNHQQNGGTAYGRH